MSLVLESVLPARNVPSAAKDTAPVVALRSGPTADRTISLDPKANIYLIESGRGLAREWSRPRMQPGTGRNTACYV